jgi:Asp/Glu/hydantoin racemase
MKILIINPNISNGISELIKGEARLVANENTDVVMRTAQTGVEYIETRMEALIAGGVAGRILAEERNDVDGAVLAAFGDPGIPALKELVDLPVVGVTEAAMHTAALQGANVGIVAISRRIIAWYRETIEQMGMGSMVASVRSLESPIHNINSLREEFRDELLSLIQFTADHDGADVVIMAGAPLAGYARQVRGRSPVPIVDGIAAATKQCELLVSLGCGVHRSGSFSRPPGKNSKGLSSEIKNALEQRPV